MVLKKRKLGNTDLWVSELGLGAMDTPNSPSAKVTVHHALDSGINFIDTARIYKNSEYLLGQVVRERGLLDFCIATKTISRSAAGVQYDVDKSRTLLGVDSIDLYQLDDVSLHDWEKILDKGGALEGLRIAQHRGLIRYIGITSHDLALLKLAIPSGYFDSVMIEYSAFFHETNALIKLADTHKLGVIAMRPLGGSGRTSTIRALENRAIMASVNVSGLLCYVLSNQLISVAIVGSSYPDRVTENVKTATTYTAMDAYHRHLYEKQAKLLD